MTILLLAGTREARLIADGLAERDIPALASLSGATREPVDLPLPTRVGGFGGEEGFRAVLGAEGVRGVLDATHPFATRITARTHAVCNALGLALLRVERPGWGEGTWTHVADATEAILLIPPEAVVFLATGRQSLTDWAELRAARVHLRVIDEPASPFPYPGGYVVARPPFDLDAETALFARLCVTHLVAKDSGGTGGRTKLDAAIRLGIKVFLLRRPDPPVGLTVVERVDEALDWATAIAALEHGR